MEAGISALGKTEQWEWKNLRSNRCWGAELSRQLSLAMCKCIRRRLKMGDARKRIRRLFKKIWRKKMMVSMTMMILDLKNFGLAKELGLTGYCDCSGGREAGVNVNSRFLAAETKKLCHLLWWVTWEENSGEKEDDELNSGCLWGTLWDVQKGYWTSRSAS